MKLAIDGGKPLLKKMTFEIRPGNEEIQSVIKTMKKGYLASFEGKNTVAEFENKFADYNLTKHAVAFNTGTSAIHSSIASMNAKKNGEVIVPVITFITGITPMLIEGLRPVFVDIDSNNLGLNHSLLEEALTENTVGVLPTHLLGVPCEIQKIQRFTKKNSLFLIEDCAQAHGAEVNGKKVGTFGDAGCFSFYVSKNMTTGEGGMTITNKDSVYTELIKMRQCGKLDPLSNQFSRMSFNYRMTDLCAAVGIPQLKKLDNNNKHRLKAASIYEKRLKKHGVNFLPKCQNVLPAYYKFPIILPREIAEKRDYFVSALEAENVNLEQFNYPLLNKVDFLRKIALRDNYSQKFYEEQFPVAEELDKRLLTLPVKHNIPLSRIEDICDAIDKVINNARW